MSGADHQRSVIVEEAAEWLAKQNPPPRPIVPAMRQIFPLTAAEACEVCALAQRYRTNLRAFS